MIMNTVCFKEVSLKFAYTLSSGTGFFLPIQLNKLILISSPPNIFSQLSLSFVQLHKYSMFTDINPLYGTCFKNCSMLPGLMNRKSPEDAPEI